MQTFSDSSVTRKPLVSLLTVVRNGKATIRECIESVLAQTYPLIEHIIVDGGSTDGTLDIIREYGIRIGPWISEPDSGIYNALNKAVRLAGGQYYIPLGCDDVLLPTAAEDLIFHARCHKVIMGKVQCIGRTGHQRKIYNHSAGTLISMSAHDQLGLYDESYKIAADTKFLELAKQAGLVNRIDQEVGKFVLGGASSNYSKNILEHARAMHESGSWSVIRSWFWVFPRLIYAKLKR
jgi:glycosyltransferase involved in cell wall biosynthesis